MSLGHTNLSYYKAKKKSTHIDSLRKALGGAVSQGGRRRQDEALLPRSCGGCQGSLPDRVFLTAKWETAFDLKKTLCKKNPSEILWHPVGSETALLPNSHPVPSPHTSGQNWLLQRFW